MELKSLKIVKDIKNKITEPLPEYIISERDGGGKNPDGSKKKLRYLEGHTVIDMLNNYFGYAWNWRVTKEWIEQSIDAFNTYNKGPDKVFYDGKEGTWETQPPVAHVLGTLTVFLLNENNEIIRIEKDGYGSKVIRGKVSDQEHIFKAAGTDALKKAASLFGIGLELYRNEGAQIYHDNINYEDPWTEEEMEKYEKERQFIKDYIDQTDSSDEDMDALINEFSNGEYPTMEYLAPWNIVQFYNYLQKYLETN